ncbi:MAG: L-threonine 3-dehydrogenase [Clostridia bacterium]|nr:L-threonine 3-dehydrogenase [Clostridia bacterium]
MTKMMDALVKTEAGKGLTLMQIPVPTPGMGEVLIKIRKTAICGTDVHIYNWDSWSEQHIKPPMAVGHEYVGEIAELGEGVSGLHIGQRVSGEGHIVCGHCRNCRSGNGQWCVHTKGVGVDRQGAFAEYLCIPASNVVPMDDNDIPDDIISFFDAYGNATHTALMFDVVGEDVLITGAGPIGIMAAAICRHNGARNVLITDVNEYRLDLAKKMGATPVNVAKEKLEDVMKACHVKEGFDVGLEMSGNGRALNQLIGAMRNGGKVALLGIAGPGTVVDWNEIIFKGLTLQGIYGRKMYETWYKMGAMVEAGLDLSPIVTHRFNYRDFEKGFEAMNSGQSGKVVLDWTK